MADLYERAMLIHKASNNVELQAVLNEKCRRDILFWFTHFCWTYNPRQAPRDFPFNLYPFQEKLVLALCTCIDEGSPFLIKKSRDMGATWIILLTFQWYWLFKKGSDFHLTSITENDVDQIGDKSTMFEKLRYNLRFLPKWMAPEMNRNSDSFMKLINSNNGNSITGQAPVVDFGRSRRYTAVMMDEMARLKHGPAMYSSVANSTDCIIMPYTPYGKTNEAYRLSKSDDLEVVALG